MLYIGEVYFSFPYITLFSYYTPIIFLIYNLLRFIWCENLEHMVWIS